MCPGALPVSGAHQAILDTRMMELLQRNVQGRSARAHELAVPVRQSISRALIWTPVVLQSAQLSGGVHFNMLAPNLRGLQIVRAF